MSKRDVRKEAQERVRFLAKFIGMKNSELELLNVYSVLPRDYSLQHLNDDLYLIMQGLQNMVFSYQREVGRISRSFGVEHEDIEADRPRNYTFGKMLGDLLNISISAKAGLHDRESRLREISEILKDRESEVCYLQRELRGRENGNQ